MKLLIIKVPEDIRKEAEERSQKLAELHKGRWTKFDSPDDNYSGEIGRIVIQRYFKENGLNPISDDELHGKSDKFDIKIKEKLVEVKTQIIKDYEPQLHWRCEINKKQKDREDRKFDFVVFIKLNLVKNLAYVVGFISYDKFMEKAKFHPKGEIMDDNKKSWAVKEDKYDVRIDELNNSIVDLIDILKH